MGFAGCKVGRLNSLKAHDSPICVYPRCVGIHIVGPPTLASIFLSLPREERNQRFLFVKNESIKFCCSGGFSNVPDVVETSVSFISTVFHVRRVLCRCLYLGLPTPCAARVTRVTCSKRVIPGVPLEAE